MVDIEVAVFGVGAAGPGEEEARIPLAVPAETTLGRARLLAIREAPQAFAHAFPEPSGVPLNTQWWQVALRDRESGSFRVFLDRVHTIDPQGAVLFNQPLEDVTIRELWRSADAGLLDFELDRQVIGVYGEFGGANGEFITSVLSAWPVLSSFLAGVGVTVVGNLLTPRIRALLDILVRSADTFRRRNARPVDVLRLVYTNQRWPVDELTRRLPLSPEAAMELLSLLEYAPSPEEARVYVATRPRSEQSVVAVIEQLAKTEFWLVLTEDTVEALRRDPTIGLLVPDDWREDRQCRSEAKRQTD